MQPITADTIFLPALGILFIIIFLANIFGVLKNSKQKATAKKKKEAEAKKKATAKKKSDFSKQYSHLVQTINLLKLELRDAKKLSTTIAEKKKVKIAEERILKLI